MSKERSKDKGGTKAGLSKSYNNNRGTSGKMRNSESTSNTDMVDTGHRKLSE
jgi:hypothetical protein